MLKPIKLSNLDADMPEKIHLAWLNFAEKYSELKNKINNKSISRYSNYESNEKAKQNNNTLTLQQLDKVEGGWPFRSIRELYSGFKSEREELLNHIWLVSLVLSVYSRMAIIFSSLKDKK